MATATQLPDLILQHATNKPNTLAVTDGQRHLTWKQYLSCRNQLYWALKNLRLPENEAVTIYSQNSIEYAIGISALNSAGITYVCMNWHLVADEVEYILRDSNTVAVIVGFEFLPIVEKLRNSLPGVRHWIIVSDKDVPTWAVSFTSFIQSGKDINPEQILPARSIRYTGGTTGRPKGALRIAAGLSPLTLAAVQELGFFHPNGIHLVAGPIYHSAPGAFLSFAFTLGNTIVILKAFRPEHFLQLIEKYQATSTFMAPTMLKIVFSLPQQVLDKYKPKVQSFKTLIIGAAPCPMKLKEQTLDYFGPVLYEFYGSTELGINAILKPEDQLRKPGSCGKPPAGVQIRITDPKTGNDVPTGQEGIVCFVQNEAMIQKYLNDDKKTKELFGGKESTATVGDIGKLDEEGFLYICDRAIDMVISGGVNIYPAEVEDVLHRLPQIADVAVLGVPDDKWGESVHAAVVVKQGEKLTAEDVQKFCRERMAAFKVPRSISFHSTADFPRDSAGKILKRKLREKLAASRQQSKL